MAAFTYNGARIADGGKDQMRFELGDTMVAESEKTAYLSDEEIAAVLAKFPNRWKRAKLELVKSLLFRFSYEVDTKTGPVSWSLGQRHAMWKKLYDELKAEVAANESLPSLPDCTGRPPYFVEGMHDNREGMGGARRVPAPG